MLKGFRDFIMRGNIVDLAVGVVIGVAFNDLVGALTKDFITPLINLIGGGGSFGGTFVVMGQTFRPGDFVGQVINFLLVAAALYFMVVLPMNKLNERRLTADQAVRHLRPPRRRGRGDRRAGAAAAGRHRASDSDPRFAGLPGGPQRAGAIAAIGGPASQR